MTVPRQLALYWSWVGGRGAGASAASLRRVEAFLCSFPKSGRTWLRYALALYMCSAHRLEQPADLRASFSVLPEASHRDGWGLDAFRYAGRLPLFAASHESYRSAFFRDRPILFMTRNPLDVMVSYYHHVSSKRPGRWLEPGAFLRSRKRGLRRYVRYLNGWSAHLNEHRHRVVSYEEMRRRPRETLREVVDFLGMPVDAEGIERTVARTDFEEMRSLEEARPLHPQRYARRDPASRRVRRGVVGGYREELSAEDQRYAESLLERRLSPRSRELLARAGSFPLRDPR